MGSEVDAIEAPEFGETVPGGPELMRLIQHHLDEGRLVVLVPDGMTPATGKAALLRRVVGIAEPDEPGYVVVARQMDPTPNNTGSGEVNP